MTALSLLSSLAMLAGAQMDWVQEHVPGAQCPAAGGVVRVVPEFAIQLVSGGQSHLGWSGDRAIWISDPAKTHVLAHEVGHLCAPDPDCDEPFAEAAGVAWLRAHGNPAARVRQSKMRCDL